MTRPLAGAAESDLTHRGHLWLKVEDGKTVAAGTTGTAEVPAASGLLVRTPDGYGAVSDWWAKAVYASQAGRVKAVLCHENTHGWLPVDTVDAGMYGIDPDAWEALPYRDGRRLLAQTYDWTDIAVILRRHPAPEVRKALPGWAAGSAWQEWTMILPAVQDLSENAGQ